MNFKHPIACMIACLILPAAAIAQSYPARPVKVIAPFPPGSGPDLIVRMFGARMADLLGQPVVIENQGGANGMIGGGTVARAAPDGYTLLFGNTSTHVTAILISKSVPYDPVKDFTPISIAVEPATCIAVNADLPVKSIADLVDYARRNPGKLSYASPGVGSVFHLTSEMFASFAKLAIVHVPYKGQAGATADLVAGRVQMASTSLGEALPQVRAGKVRILGILEGRRYASLPDMPTVSETLAGFEKPPSWHGYLGPAGMQPPVVARVRETLQKTLAMPEIRSKLLDMGQTPVGSSPAEFAAQLKSGIEAFGAVTRAIGIKPE